MERLLFFLKAITVKGQAGRLSVLSAYILFLSGLINFAAAQTPDSIPQKDLIDIGKSLFKIKPGPPSDNQQKKIYFSLLPTTSSGHGSGSVFVTSTTAGFYLGDPKNTFLSTVTFAPYWNLRARFGLPLRSNIWLNNNLLTIQGDTRFLVYPQYTYGLNSRSPASDRVFLNSQYVRFYQSVLFRVKPYFFAGFGYNLDSHLDIETNTGTSIKTVTNYPYGTATDLNSFSSGYNVSLLYDTRNNLLNPLPGGYVNIIYRDNTKFMGSNNSWQSLYIDVRKYISLSKENHQLFAFWTYYWTTLTTGTPYLDLPSIGWDPYNRSGRGIPQSRYRGRHLLYGEGEFRSNLTGNGLFGFVLFANINSVAQPQNTKFVYFHPAEGFGLRIKFNKKSNTNIAADYAFSSGYHGLSLNLGEAF